MSFRYDVNLIKGDVARRQSTLGVVQVLTVCLLLMIFALVVTYAVYLLRDMPLGSASRAARQELETLATAAEEAPAKAATLRAKANEISHAVNGCTAIVDRCVSWSNIMVAIQQCCTDEDLKLATVHSDADDRGVFVRVTGQCTSDNPLESVRAFMDTVADHPVFLVGAIADMKQTPDGLTAFCVEMALAGKQPREETLSPDRE